MDHWSILVKTFKQWWVHKYLWIVGILAAMFAGGGSSGGSFPSSGNSSSSASYKEFTDSVMNFLSDPTVVTTIIIVFIVLVIIGTLFTILSLYIQARADSALFQATKQIGSDNKKIGFWNTWRMGKFRLGTLIKLQLIVSGPMYLIGMALVVLLIVLLLTSGGEFATIITGFWLVLVCSAICLCFVMLYAIIVGVINVFGKRISVLENTDAIVGFKKGYAFLKKNISDVLVFWLLSLIYGTVISLVTVVIIFIVLFVGIAIIVPLIIVNIVLGLIVAVIIGILFGFVMALISGPVYAFGQMYWTNVYLAIKSKA